MCVPVPVEGELRWIENEGKAEKLSVDALVFSRRKRRQDVPIMTMNEVQEAAQVHGRALVVIDGRVLDVAKWARHHPGGVGPLFHGAGKDMTDQFAQFHSKNTYKMLGQFHIADVAVADTKARGQDPLHRDWDKFTQDILAEGLYETSYAYFAMVFLRTMLLLVATFALLWWSRDTAAVWVTLSGAVCFGLFLQQMNFLGHDLGHNGVTHNTKIDKWLGIVCGNLLTGVGIWWWKDSHNNHHIVCNSIEHDADIQHMPFITCNKKIMEKPFFSTWHRNWHSAQDFACRYLLVYQHIIYYPAIMCFARYNLYVQSVLHILRGKSRDPVAELVALCGFATMTGAMLWLLSDWRHRVAFTFVSHAVAGILNIQITLSHFCMDVYNGSPYRHGRGIEDQWVWTQMKTTLALTCPVWMDWFHGGLQFQDVHHLLPRVPRHNLRQLRPRIRALCKKHRCTVSPEISFLDANIRTWRLVREAAQSARALKPRDSNSSSDSTATAARAMMARSLLFDTLFARG